MNTPAHLIINLATLGSAAPRRHTAAIALGALLPDMPLFFFYFWEKLVAGSSEALIWQTLYFEPHWQAFFDLFNSVPLALLVLATATIARVPAVAWAAASALLHFALDLPLHHDDGHRHFYPLTHWRFESPISYWDPNHYGSIAAAAELAAMWGSSTILWRRFPTRTARTALTLACALSATAYTAFYILGLAPPA